MQKAKPGNVRSLWACASDSGATAVEYSIMVALIALVVFGAVVAVGQATGGMYDCIATALEGMPAEPDC